MFVVWHVRARLSRHHLDQGRQGRWWVYISERVPSDPPWAQESEFEGGIESNGTGVRILTRGYGTPGLTRVLHDLFFDDDRNKTMRFIESGMKQVDRKALEHFRAAFKCHFDHEFAASLSSTPKPLPSDLIRCMREVTKRRRAIRHEQIIKWAVDRRSEEES